MSPLAKDGSQSPSSAWADIEPPEAVPRFVIDDVGCGGDRDRLRRDIGSVTSWLRHRGLKTGDRVLLCMPNSYRFVVVHLALERLGAVTVNLPTAFRHELVVIARQSQAALAVVPPERCAELDGHGFSFVPDGVDLLRRLVVCGPTAAPVTVAAGQYGDAVRWLAYTSGSTGTPRPAVHTRATMRAATDAMIRRYELTSVDTILVAAPVGHAMGFSHGVRLAVDAGCGLVLQSSWNAARAVDLLDQFGCDFAAVPAPFLVDLVALGRQPRRRVRHLQVGGAPVATGCIQQADVLFGEGVVGRYYGSSECGAVLTTPLGAARTLRHSADGMRVPGVELRLEGTNRSEGELVVRGQQLARGYWMGHDPGRQFDDDGWFHTGDLAVAVGPDAFRIVGRLDDMVIRGGVNVMPAVVEQHLAAHERIQESVVVGAPHLRYGEILIAFVILAGDSNTLTFGDVRAYLRSIGLARSSWPDKVIVRRSLPRGATGKPDRTVLRAAAADHVRPGRPLGMRLVEDAEASRADAPSHPELDTRVRELAAADEPSRRPRWQVKRDETGS